MGGFECFDFLTEWISSLFSLVNVCMGSPSFTHVDLIEEGGDFYMSSF